MAQLPGADLRGVVLLFVKLEGADLRSADLSHADAISANQRRADLSGANLSRADLSRADLSRANLSGAIGVTNDELVAQTNSLEGVTMPNGQKYEDWLKDKEGSGENGKNSSSS